MIPPEWLRPPDATIQGHEHFTYQTRALLANRVIPGMSVQRDAVAQILDVACGEMDEFEALRETFPNASITGVDINRKPYATALLVYPDRAHMNFLQQNAATNFPSGPWPLIICRHLRFIRTDPDTSAELPIGDAVDILRNCINGLERGGEMLMTFELPLQTDAQEAFSQLQPFIASQQIEILTNPPIERNSSFYSNQGNAYPDDLLIIIRKR